MTTHETDPLTQNDYEEAYNEALAKYDVLLAALIAIANGRRDLAAKPAFNAVKRIKERVGVSAARIIAEVLAPAFMSEEEFRGLQSTTDTKTGGQNVR